MRPEITEQLRRFATVTELKSCSPEELIAAVRDADALLIRTRLHITARVIEAAPKLRVIGRAGPSLDHIDIKAAKRRDITVVYTPTAQTASTADFTVAMMLSCLRRIPWYDRKIRENQFEMLRTPYGRHFANTTIGLLGGGPIAAEVARVFVTAFRSRVLNHAPAGTEPVKAAGVSQVARETLFCESDAISCHLPSTDTFNNSIGEAEIAMMKRSACLINTSRGAVLDNHALAEALKTHRIAGAALDVFDAEPLPANHPLRNAPNCILTPHIAATTLDAADAYMSVTEDILRVLHGEQPRFPATPRKGADGQSASD